MPEQLKDRLPRIDRRRFLKLGTLTMGACLCFSVIPDLAEARRQPCKALSLYNPNTDESLMAPFCVNGRYEPDVLAEINYFFRDFHINQIKKIDIRLLDYLYAISKSLRLTPRQPFHIISGYRSPQTNALLRRKSKKVAKNSYHIKGMAVDIRLARMSTRTLRKAAMRLHLGGVGYYPRSRFIHIDVGPIRHW